MINELGVCAILVVLFWALAEIRYRDQRVKDLEEGLRICRSVIKAWS